jgi:hypothetical protein
MQHAGVGDTETRLLQSIVDVWPDVHQAQQKMQQQQQQQQQPISIYAQQLNFQATQQQHSGSQSMQLPHPPPQQPQQMPAATEPAWAAFSHGPPPHQQVAPNPVMYRVGTVPLCHAPGIDNGTSALPQIYPTGVVSTSHPMRSIHGSQQLLLGADYQPQQHHWTLQPQQQVALRPVEAVHQPAQHPGPMYSHASGLQNYSGSQRWQ